jgi:hypothetical protein
LWQRCKLSVMAHKNRKVWLWISGMLIFLGIGGYVGWRSIKKDLSKPNSKVEQELSEQFADMIIEASDSLYKVSFTKFDVNLDSGKGRISNFKLVPDTVVLARLIKSNRAPNNVLNVDIKDLVLSDLKIQKGANGLRMNLHRMLIDSSSVTVANTLRPYNVNSDEKKHGKLFSLMKDLLKMSNVQSITFRNMDFIYVNRNFEKEKKTSLRNLNIDLSGFTAVTTDSAGQQGSQIRVKAYRLATPDSLYYLTATDISFFPEMRKAKIKQVELSPRLTKKAFYERVKWAKDRIFIVQKDVEMNGIDLQKILQQQQLHMTSMNVGYSMVEVYTNYNWPRKVPKVRPNPFPHQQLQLIAFDLTIDTMRMKNSDIYYRVLAMKSDQTSSLDINNSKGVVLNITNNKAAIQKNRHLKASFASKVMAAAPMQLDIDFDLRDTKGAFSYTARMGSVDAKVLNRFAEPFSLMSIKSGRINRMYMQVNADESTAKGKVNLYYKDMKYALLKNEDDTKQLKERKVISSISNLFLPNDNPNKRGKFKDGPINITRPANMSFFGYLAKASVDGMSSSITGLEQKKKQPESNVILEAGEAIIGGPGKKSKK